MFWGLVVGILFLVAVWGTLIYLSAWWYRLRRYDPDRPMRDNTTRWERLRWWLQ
jgi:hypothetical protein